MFDDIEGGELAIILAAVAVIGYGIYKAGGSLSNFFSSIKLPSLPASVTGTPLQGFAPCTIIPGTGETVAQLQALGYSNTEIATMWAQAQANPSCYQSGSVNAPSCPGFFIAP